MKARGEQNGRQTTQPSKNNTQMQHSRSSSKRRISSSRKEAHKLSFLKLCFLLFLLQIAKAAANRQLGEGSRRQEARGSKQQAAGSRRQRPQGVTSWRLRFRYLPAASLKMLPTRTMRGFKKCRIPEAAVQSVELKTSPQADTAHE